MKFTRTDIVLQEVPNEVSIVFEISGCPHKCEGCHSNYLAEDKGKKLTAEVYRKVLNNYRALASCVLFMGGEWDEDIKEFLDIARAYGFKTALYTGAEWQDLESGIKKRLDYLKVGAYKAECGGLSEKSTNQRFIDLNTKEDKTYLFRRA
jgi:anaerobic ribonucleoside-triphosphate reductase activating protein